MFTFWKKTQTEIDSIPIAEGNILFNQTTKEITVDDNGVRTHYGGTVTVDSALSTTSTNPVQNQAIGNVIGFNDISTIGDGTTTGAIIELNGRADLQESAWDFTILTTDWVSETGGQYYTDILYSGLDITSFFPDVDHVGFSMITTGYASDDNVTDSELFQKGYATVSFDATNTNITFHVISVPSATITLQARL